MSGATLALSPTPAAASFAASAEPMHLTVIPDAARSSAAAEPALTAAAELQKGPSVLELFVGVLPKVPSDAEVAEAQTSPLKSAVFQEKLRKIIDETQRAISDSPLRGKHFDFEMDQRVTRLKKLAT
jgi:hypothetical protein